MIDFRTLSLRQLRALTATARYGSVTAAARSLHVTPPAITSQLKLLEQTVGATLFERSGSSFLLTEIGQELADATADIENSIQRAADRITALRSGAAGSVVFAGVSTAKYFAPSIVAAFQRENPNIRVKLVIGNRGEIIAGLKGNEYDLLLMGRPPEGFPIESTGLGNHPHILIAAPDHRLAGKKSIHASDLLEERFLTREVGSGTRMLTERLLSQNTSSRAFDTVEMGTNETIKQAVIAGLGIALISAHTCMTELADKRLVSLNCVGVPMMRKWFLVRRTDRHLTTAARMMREFLIRERRHLLPK